MYRFQRPSGKSLGSAGFMMNGAGGWIHRASRSRQRRELRRRYRASRPAAIPSPTKNRMPYAVFRPSGHRRWIGSPAPAHEGKRLIQGSWGSAPGGNQPDVFVVVNQGDAQGVLQHRNRFGKSDAVLGDVAYSVYKSMPPREE